MDLGRLFQACDAGAYARAWDTCTDPNLKPDGEDRKRFDELMGLLPEDVRANVKASIRDLRRYGKRD